MDLKKLCYSVFLIFICMLFLASGLHAQDPNFYIYLAFGQSNMEGQGAIEEIDETVDSRFQVLEATDCSNLGRTKGSWYPAIPPLTRCYSGLSPADYFGRTMVLNLPDSIRVGIINVSVAGCKIELYDKENYADYVSTVTEDWLINIINAYDGNPYQYLVDMARLAQQDGIIKGFLLHQGEANNGDSKWPSKVKDIYNNLIADLSLSADSIPLLAGEVVHADQGGVTAGMNSIIAVLPDTLPNSYVVSSSGCPDGGDNLHFSSAGYRELGMRYATTMLSTMGFDPDSLIYPEIPVVIDGTIQQFYEAECATVGADWDILTDAQASGDRYVSVKAGIQSLNTGATDSAGVIYIPFTLDSAGTYNFYARLNCPTYDDDSFWIKVDDESYTMVNGLVTSGWQWMNLNSYNLSVGAHLLTISYREDGAKLDKVCISNYANVPEGLGDDALNSCTATGFNDPKSLPSAFSIEQNYPNPFNPQTLIKLNIPVKSRVTLEVMDINGRSVARLFYNAEISGACEVVFDGSDLSSGVYIYQLRTSTGFIQSRKMLLIK